MKNNERDERKTRKVLVPLATLAVAAAVAVGSGATFTSTSQIKASVTAGRIGHTNDHPGQTLTIDQLKPGDSAFETVTLTQDGNSNLNGDLSIKFSNVTSGFDLGAVKVSVVGNGQSGLVDLEDIEANGASDTINLGRLSNSWGSTPVKITVSMDPGAGNTNQGKKANAKIEFVLTATDGSDHETTADWTP